jgi:hypothetical protein
MENGNRETPNKYSRKPKAQGSKQKAVLLSALGFGL